MPFGQLGLQPGGHVVACAAPDLIGVEVEHEAVLVFGVQKIIQVIFLRAGEFQGSPDALAPAVERQAVAVPQVIALCKS